MTDNKSFRIESKFNKATLWSVGKFHYSIKWDDEDATVTVPKFHIDTLLKEGHWVVVPEKKTDYVRECIDRLNSYTGCMSYNDSYVGEPSGMLKSTIRQLDKAYNPEKKDISNLPIKIVVDSTEADKQLVHTIALAKELEEAIKSLRNVLGVEFVTLNIEGIV